MMKRRIMRSMYEVSVRTGQWLLTNKISQTIAPA